MCSLHHVTNCTDLQPFATALNCRCFSFVVRLRIASAGPIWKASMYDACLLVHALLRNNKRSAASRQRLYAFNRSRECEVIRVITVLLLPPIFMSCCILRANHFAKVEVSAKSWSLAAAKKSVMPDPFHVF